jgi:hypothetical protein
MIADRCHPKDRAGNQDEASYDDDLFTGCKLIELGISAKGSRFNQLYFPDWIFPDVKGENVNLHRRLFGSLWTIQCATMNQEWYQNSRSIMFHDHRTHAIYRA